MLSLSVSMSSKMECVCPSPSASAGTNVNARACVLSVSKKGFEYVNEHTLFLHVPFVYVV